jgi:hypothetical protein
MVTSILILKKCFQSSIRTINQKSTSSTPKLLQKDLEKNPTLELQNNINVYKCRQEQIYIIEKRRKLRKTVRKNKKRDQISHHNSDLHSYKGFKAMKNFESALNDEIKKVEEESEVQKRFKGDDSDDTEDEEEFIIIEHRPDPSTVIGTPIQDGVAPAETQPVVKHRSNLRDDN